MRLSEDIVRLPTDASLDATAARPSADELVPILLIHGATVLARQAHGVLLRAGRHLIFVRRTSVVGETELLDALHATGVAVSRFVELLAERRCQAA
jgi:hypothetical protein